MKEFIEKLIDGLREQSAYSCGQCMDEAIEVVCKIAEEYNNGWIPCEVRLPEEDEWVLGQGTYDIMITCLTETYKDKKQWMDINGDNRKIIAWQPLPAPYKKGE